MTGFIVPHAMEFYRTAESSGSHGDRLRKLASWISDQRTDAFRDL